MCNVSTHTPILRQSLSYPKLKSNSLCSKGRPWVSDSFAYCTHPLLLVVLQIYTTCLALQRARVQGWALCMLGKSSANGTAYISRSPSPRLHLPELGRKYALQIETPNLVRKSLTMCEWVWLELKEGCPERGWPTLFWPLYPLSSDSHRFCPGFSGVPPWASRHRREF